MNKPTEARDSRIERPIPKKRALMNDMDVPFGARRMSGSILRVFKPRRRTISVMSTRTTATAVNIEIAIPRNMATANPRTGPEPNMNSSVVAISDVMFASIMVE